MQPDTHPYYTEIQRRSYDAIVKNGWLTEVVLAFAVDPKEPYKIGDSLVRDAHQQLVIVPDDPRSMPIKAPIEPAVIAKISKKAGALLKLTIEQWVSRQEDARSAMIGVTLYDAKLGAWCAARLCRESVASSRSIPPSTRLAIETAERWSVGESTAAEARSRGQAAAQHAESARRTSLFDAYAGYAAAYAAAIAAYAPSPDAAARAAECAVFSARAIASAPSAPGPYRATHGGAGERDELVRLTSVVARACRYWPGP